MGNTLFINWLGSAFVARQRSSALKWDFEGNKLELLPPAGAEKEKLKM